MADLLTSIDHILEELEGRGVTLVDCDALRSYLAHHAAAADILLPALDVTRSHLGKTPQLSLEIYRDPEIGGEQLSLYVRSNEYSEHFLEGLQVATEEVRRLRAGKDDNFLVTTDFQPPR